MHYGNDETLYHHRGTSWHRKVFNECWFQTRKTHFLDLDLDVDLVLDLDLDHIPYDTILCKSDVSHRVLTSQVQVQVEVQVQDQEFLSFAKVTNQRLTCGLIRRNKGASLLHQATPVKKIKAKAGEGQADRDEHPSSERR